MAFVVKDRIKETTTTTGTGTYTLAGAAIGGYNTFAEIGTGSTTYYACTDGTDWEVGLGTYTASGTTLSRDQIIESSNSNSAVNWGSGSKDIFVTLPSSKALVMDDNDEFNVNGGDAIRFGADQASSFSRMSLSINGSVGALGMSEPSIGNSTLNLTAQNLRGIGDGGDLHFLGATTGAGSSISLYGGNTKVFETSKTGAGASITGNLSVSGDLTVNGTTTTVNSTTVTIDDPVFTLGGDTAPASDDNKDRGIEFRWHDGTAAKLGFFGYDDSEGKLTFIPDATNTSEVFSGSVGTILANVEGSLTGNADTASAADFLTGLADPNADRLLMWDDSASGHAYVTIGSNLSLSGTTLTSTDTTYSAGTGLSLSGTTFTNTAPDQTVSLTGSGATSISGTYPSFTISSTNTTYSAGTGLSLSGTTFTNTAPDQTVTLTGSGATSISGTYPNFTISSTDTNTTYSASTGLNLSGTTFSIDTSVVPQLSTDNEFSGSIYLQEDEEFAFYNASNSVVATLHQDDTTDLLTLQNHNQRVDIKGNSGVRLWHDDTTTDNFGVHVYETSGNVFGALCFNGTEKIVTNASGVSVVGSLNTTSNTTVSGDLTVDSGVLYASSTLNRVGINTTSPTGALEITQTANTSPWGESGIKINNSTGSQFAGIGFRSTFGLYISAGAGSATDNEIRFITSNQGTEGIRMTIDSNGSVGIGTSSPTSELHLHVSGASNGAQIKFDSDYGIGYVGQENNTSNNLIIGSSTAGITFYAADSEAMRLDASGNVGIGTTSPEQKLHVEGSIVVDAFNAGSETGIFFREGFSSSNKYNVSILAYDYSGSAADGLSINAYDGIAFCTGSNSRNEVMRITGGASNVGRVGIGTTSPSAPLTIATSGNQGLSDAVIDIVSNLTTSGATRFLSISEGTTTAAHIAYSHDNNNLEFISQQSNGGISFYTGGTNNRLEITEAGNVGIGTGSPTNILHVSSSVARVKIENTGADEAHIELKNASGSAFVGAVGAANELLTGSAAGDMVIGNRMGGKLILSADSSAAQHHISIAETGYTTFLHNDGIKIGGNGSTPDATTATYEQGVTITGGNMRLVIDTSNVVNGGAYIQTRHNSASYPNSYYTLALNPLGGNVTVNGNTVFHTGNDGSGSGLDADTVDGVHGSSFLRSDAADSLTASSQHLLTIEKTGTPTSGSTLKVINDEGDHSWGIVGEFRVDGTSGSDRPSILFSSGYNTTTWSVGYGSSDDNFRINTGHGYHNGSWGTTRFSIDGSGNLYAGNINSNKIWHAGNDGSGSGLDADLWDGNQFSSYLNQAVLTTSSPTFSSVGVNNAAWIRDITGQYGSIEIDGAATGGYEGYSIGGRAVFMHDNSTQTGIYNDVNNQWILRATHNNMTALYYAGSEKMRTLSTGIQVNGTVSIVSDRNLKENIKPIDSSLIKLEQITGYSFDYKDSGGKGHGIIAQELEEIIPDAVQVNDEGFKQVDYNSVIALLINAVKELNEKVQELESNANTYTG